MNKLERAIAESSHKPLLGASIYFYNPIFLEIVAYLGFDVVWIEMEHAFITFAEAADLCRMASGHKLLTMIRVADPRRESILKAAECGPDLIDLPMGNSPEEFRDLVRHARFPPIGERGYFSVSRSLRYGLVENVPRAQQQVNQELSLLAQVETADAVDRIDELCSVEGVDIVIGPADLSASLDIPGEVTHPKLLAAARHVVETAHRHGKRVATAINAADAKPWIELGIDLLFCANDIVALKQGAHAALQQIGQIQEGVRS